MMDAAGEETLVVDASSSKPEWKHERVAKAMFSLVAIFTYTSLLVLLWMHTWNAIHMAAWLGAVCSSTYVLCVYHIIIFSDNLCYHTMSYQLVSEINLI